MPCIRWRRGEAAQSCVSIVGSHIAYPDSPRRRFPNFVRAASGWSIVGSMQHVCRRRNDRWRTVPECLRSNRKPSAPEAGQNDILMWNQELNILYA